MSDIWATIAAERGTLANDLTGLTPSDWDTPWPENLLAWRGGG